MPARIAVLVSGTGTNLQALLDHPAVGPCIALVASDRPGAGALDRARDRQIPTEVLEWEGFPDRDAFALALLARLREHQIEHVVLAGFMRILPPLFIRAFPFRILNTHPALLPAFRGATAVRDALEWGVKLSGVTVHFVDEEVDHGPVVLQEAVPVHPDDDERSLHERIKRVEHRLFPEAVHMLIEGRLKVDGRRVHVLGQD